MNEHAAGKTDMSEHEATRAIAYLRRFETRWPRLGECADVMAALEAARAQLRTAFDTEVRVCSARTSMLDDAKARVRQLEAEREQLIGQITDGRAAEGELRAEFLELKAALARKDEALRRIIDNAEAWHGVAQKNDGHAKALAVIATWARAALGQA